MRSGNWNPENDKDDQDERNALAARGYWQAFQRVRTSIERVLRGENAGAVADNDHAAWYRELFGPGVTAGILKAADLAGYRNGLFIRPDAGKQSHQFILHRRKLRKQRQCRIDAQSNRQ